MVSSALIWPYAKRFVSAVHNLRNKNIPTLQVLDAFRVPSIKRDIVVYQPLEGLSLRSLIRKKTDTKKLMLELARFFAQLHEQGIYFRSIHFNNVIVTGEGSFGLIDVADLHFSSAPLSISKRVRNFNHILHCKEDREAFALVTVDAFLGEYVKNAAFKSEQKAAIFTEKASRFCAEKMAGLAE